MPHNPLILPPTHAYKAWVAFAMARATGRRLWDQPYAFIDEGPFGSIEWIARIPCPVHPDEISLQRVRCPFLSHAHVRIFHRAIRIYDHAAYLDLSPPETFRLLLAKSLPDRDICLYN